MTKVGSIYQAKPFVYVIKEIVKYIDGDTIDVIIDLGFSTFVKKRIRLHGIDTPETRTRDKEEKKRGLKAKARLIELCEESTEPLVLISHGVGKYGRVLGEIRSHPNTVINSILVIEGHAREYYGK
jgi:micrococcal nuclease